MRRKHKPQVIAANKIDCIYDDDENPIDLIRAEFEPKGIKVFPILHDVTEIGRHVIGRGLFSPLPYCSPGMIAVLSAMTAARLAASKRFPS